MSKALENWSPRILDKPDYFDTVKYVYKHIEFHISEDEAYTILNAFIEKWDENAGQEIDENQLTDHVVARLQNNFDVLLPKPRIKRVVSLILGYLFETGHFYQQQAQA